MKTILHIALMGFSLVNGVIAQPPSIPPTDIATLQQKLIPIIRKYYPDASIEVDEKAGTFTANFDTRTFEVYPNTFSPNFADNLYKMTGPNGNGFLLVIKSVKKEPRQQLGGRIERDPYWFSYFTLLPASEEGFEIDVHFSFGRRVPIGFVKRLITEGLGRENPEDATGWNRVKDW